MANYSAIKAAVNGYIKQNGRKEITGRILNAVLNATIDSLGRYFQFAGGAMPTDDPGTPDQNVCYLATEPGLYIHFGNIRIENEEVALLFWNGEWVKQSIAIGIQEVDAEVDNQVGTPSVDVSYSQGVLVLTFHNIKGEPGEKGEQGEPGEKGEQGEPGQQGESAGFGTIGADLTGGVGTPGVSVETSGDNTEKNIVFHFTNLKGEPGEQGEQGEPGEQGIPGVTSVVVSVDNTSGTPACSVSLVGQELRLNFTGLKGSQGNSGVSADYPIPIVNNLEDGGATSALSAEMGNLLMRNIKLLYDSLGAGAFWGEKPVIDWSGNSVPVSLTLTGCSIDNLSSSVPLGDPYEATITPDAGNILGSVVCTMNGVSQPVVNGVISIAEVTGSIVISAEGVNLDSVAFDGKTYRQIFETNNALGISPGFDDGTYTPLLVGAGNPTLTTEDADSGEYSLKASGTSSQQLKTSANKTGTAFVACRVKVTSYSSGYCGVQFGINDGAANGVTDGWVTKVGNKTNTTGYQVYVGSFNSANLTGYVDTPVVILKSTFGTAPSLAEFTQLYETYVAIKKAA